MATLHRERVDKLVPALVNWWRMAAADQPHPADELRSHPSNGRGVPSGTSSSADQRGLLLVGLFKLMKAVFFTSIGAGALHLVHRNLGDLVMRMVDALPIDPEGRVVSLIMDKADLIDAHDLRRIGAGAFIYATLCLVEGYGLVTRRTWAEYFTVVLTAMGLPVETFEILRRFNWYKVGALAVNVAILLYLLWVLKKRGKNTYPTTA